MEYNINNLMTTTCEPVEPIELPQPSMRWADLTRWALDIETTGTDQTTDRVLGVGLLRQDGKAAFFMDGNERDILLQTFSVLRRFQPDIIAGHNIYEFDIPFLLARAEHHGLSAPFKRSQLTLGVGNAKNPKGHGMLSYNPVETDWGGVIVDTLHLVCRWDFIHAELPAYDLKSAAEHLLEKTRSVRLSPAEIREAYKNNQQLFKAYLLEDLQDTMGLLELLAPTYFYLHQIVPDLPLDRAFTAGTSVIWDKIYMNHYPTRPEPDVKGGTYDGGLTLCRCGLFRDCAKVDVSSMYPHIMLLYNIHSRKDPDRIALRWLAALTARRLELKERAKDGDVAAKHEDAALKVLINSAYGYLGAGPKDGEQGKFAYFNDQQAAAMVAHHGRTILAAMVEAIESAGGLVVECDTDGVVFSATDADDCARAAQSALPEGFKLSLEWSKCIVFTPKAKNYTVFDADGNVLSRKGIFRKRNIPAMKRDFPVEFLQHFLRDGADAAEAYAERVLHEVASGRGWKWVAVTRRVTKNDKTLMQMGYKPGDTVTLARKKGGYSTSPADGYDVKEYVTEFKTVLDEIYNTLNGEGGDDDNGSGE